MRYIIRKPQLLTDFATHFATVCTLLAPCAAWAAFDPRAFECELFLRYPLFAVISPVIHEIPEVKTIRDKHQMDRLPLRKDWVDPRQERNEDKSDQPRFSRRPLRPPYKRER